MKQKGFSTSLVIITALLVAVIVSYFMFVRKPSDEEGPILKPEIGNSDQTADPLLVGNNAIYVSDTKSDTRVNVDFAIFAKDGYVVIHENNGGIPGAILGNSNSLSVGESRSFQVPLSRKSVDGEILYAMLHSDNGDGEFNPADDLPIRDDKGNIIFMGFQISNDAIEPGVISL